ncbi:tol-pal system protein YbgF [Candidatus Blochmanniella vafra str. BVAF]|uniref:Cell division coordinator CpoB n=1 Tax=Blochmanniella vafra (strain BVAF) TaxID=859654 RepID=E8Q6Y9_BLOVB|nr:tol-pal system protein YbgF [Candidatus Blochmannia vafer str. BVAF]
MIFYAISTGVISNTTSLDNYIHVAHAKKICSKINLDQKIKELNRVLDAHSQCLIQLQQQLLENQQDIDTLRSCIQDTQHCIQSMRNTNNTIENYEKICEKSRSNTNVINKKQQFLNNIEDADYKLAVSLVLEKKQYDRAIQTFQDFIKNYPQSNYQPNAHYWLGQLYYNQNDKNNASYHFALVVKNYPKSSKAPDALLKIGIIMQETNQIDKSKTIYKQLGKLYPNSNAAKHAQKQLTYLKNK